MVAVQEGEDGGTPDRAGSLFISRGTAEWQPLSKLIRISEYSLFHIGASAKILSRESLLHDPILRALIS